ncbi:MAG: DUF1667 domain-containing protein [Treponema sp.]|nr:DUF1667 domain-containing protein [Spirochaetia bacterium]MDY2840283.1 DUF1667 domain-containing protein [Treponema sp.]
MENKEIKTETFPMTCIICPMGCTMEVTIEDDGTTKNVTNITDNGCKRGPEYVKKEFLNPTRTLTTTIGVTGGSLAVVPVKSAGEVPKKMLFQCMEVVRRTCVKAPVKTGDILIHDILGTGINVVACANVAKI